MLQADEQGRFGEFGGRFVPETLMPAVLELENAYREIQADPAFQKEFQFYLERICRTPDAALFC